MAFSRWVEENVLAQPASTADHDFSPSIKQMVLARRIA
jgi:hypothetical protein